ncbi:hypothetical protein P154DRAFT_575512 [Amniculicola lignicola CBS 123094]|uniref:Zn(2)-C6 fungal-type domain-containing protein n=1 Tax=Amniculicola lignicola CBS 123094 TaxID=1392246 RepID=A0A6A5WKX5_9PLEO|nr:hypothetical protein P154DRAFT_575512 [Amniculicola lignicola CBS 123094]
MGAKGCWTCRERKVRCDSRWPTCGNCTKARRVCQGYGIQLSWPRDGDRKRAITLHDTHRAMKLPRSKARRFLNAYSWDMALSAELENGTTPAVARYHRSMQLPHPIYLPPAVTSKEESHLIGFFHESTSLMLGPTDAEALTQFILRIALSDSSDTTNPVLQGVLALASLQLHGSSKSFRYKRLAVSSIVKESTDWLDEKSLLQNLVATMLLYHYELSLESSSKGTWVVFFCAVKRIINTSPAMNKLVRQEYSVFLDWIYYHEVLSEFTIRHWKVPYDGCGFAPTARSPRMDGTGSMAEESIGCPKNVLELIVHTCRRTIVASSPEMQYTNAELERAKVLEQKISTAVGEFGPIRAPCAIAMDRSAMVSDLHRVACLIYANRAAHCVSGTDFRHRRLVREGMLLLGELETCQNAWPLFIIACEAVDDGQRLAILDVCERTRQDRRQRSSHIHSIQNMIKAVWNQHDLDADDRIDYLAILDAVISGLPFMPLFA